MTKLSVTTDTSDYQQILLLVNGYQDERVMTKAETLAKNFKGRLNLLSVVEFKDLIEQGLESLLNNRIEKAKIYLQNLGIQYKIPECDQYVRVGSLEEVITDFVRELQFDLFMMNKVIFSVVHDILKCPSFDVLVIQEEKENAT